MKPLLICWSFQLVLICTNLNVVASDTCEASTSGTNFMIGIIGFNSKLSGSNIHLHITTTDQTPAHVRVTVPFINMDNSYTVSNYTVIPLNDTLAQFEAGVQFKGIEVNSDVNISVSVVTGSGSDIMEGYLALPVEALGTRYVAASYYPYSSYSSEILIAGVETNTDVTLSTMLNGQVNSSSTFRLQKFETYQFKSNTDVTGSVIMSNKPVAVFSGSAVAKIPVGVGDYQFLIEQMIPVKYWATKFIIPPMYPREHFVVKILSHSNNTEVHYYKTTKHFAVYMKTRSVEEILLGKAPLVVTSTTPVSIIQYAHDGDNMDGDPFMLNAQGLTQFQSSYRFVSQNYYSGSNTIAVTIRKADVSGLRLNEHPLSYWNAVNISVPQPMEEYVIMFVNVSYNSYYRLYHIGAVKFGAILYGRYVTSVAYGYPLQLTFTDPECNYQTGSSPSSPSPTSSVTTPAPSHSNHSFEKGNGTMCFHCDGMTSLKYCDQVQKCKQENEVCFVERYPKNLNEHLYRSGCINTERCNSGSGSSDCTECCAGDFCNTAGCGDDVFNFTLHSMILHVFGLERFLSVRTKRSTMFDCAHKGEHEECSTVQLCHSNQACMVTKYEWGDNDSHYIMGCADLGACSSTRRSAPVCTKCCHSDFCNVNCTSDPVGPPIVGRQPRPPTGPKINTGFSSLEQRGPLCFDCTHKGENEGCSTVQLCHSNQACIVAKYEWGDNDSHYIMGCTDIGACSSKRAGSTHRLAPVCIKCCHSDFCNSNCTSDHVGPSIVG